MVYTVGVDEKLRQDLAGIKHGDLILMTRHVKDGDGQEPGPVREVIDGAVVVTENDPSGRDEEDDDNGQTMTDDSEPDSLDFIPVEAMGDYGAAECEETFRYNGHDSSRLFFVNSAQMDADDSVVDIGICALVHNSYPRISGSDSYQIYGSDIVVDQTKLSGASISIKDLWKGNDNAGFTITLNPDGHMIVAAVWEQRCPAGCSSGWVRIWAVLQELLAEHLLQTAIFDPVCPVCIGKDLVLEQAMLHAQRAPRKTVMNFLARLNLRRTSMMYETMGYRESD